MKITDDLIDRTGNEVYNWQRENSKDVNRKGKRTMRILTGVQALNYFHFTYLCDVGLLYVLCGK